MAEKGEASSEKAGEAPSEKGEASSSKALTEDPHMERRPSKYPSKGQSKAFVDPKMKEVITSNLKMVLGKLTSITDIITTRHQEIGGADAQQPTRIVEALRDANVAFKKLEDKKIAEHPHKK